MAKATIRGHVDRNPSQCFGESDKRVPALQMKRQVVVAHGRGSLAVAKRPAQVWTSRFQVRLSPRAIAAFFYRFR